MLKVESQPTWKQVSARISGAFFFLALAVSAVLNFQLRSGAPARRNGFLQFGPIAENIPRVESLNRIMLSIGVGVGAIFLIEALAVGWSGCSLRALLRPKSKSPWYDVVIYGLIQVGYFDTLVRWFSFGLPLFAAIFWESFGLNFLPASARFSTRNLLWDLVIYYLVFTFFDYWNHRLFHFTKLWNLHRLHHSAQEFTILTTSRNHPAAMAIEPFIRNWPIALIGLSPQGLAVFNVVTTPYFHLLHSRVGWSFGWFGRWVLVSPRSHWIHHSNEPEHQNRNLSICPLWDRLFGTWYEGPNINASIGLIDADYDTKNLAKEWYFDLKNFFVELVRVKAKR